MRTIKRKSLLYRTGVEYGDYTINHIEGCSHGCRYPCYAMLLSKRFGRIKTYSDWLKPKLVKNSLELLEEEIPKMKSKIKFVHLCFMSDPFMVGYPEIEQMSLKIIKLLNGNGIRVTTLTKGKYPKNLLNYGLNKENEYGISFVSMNPEYKKMYEPYSSKWYVRIRRLEKISKQGAKTWVSMEPYPTPNIVNQNINDLLDRIDFTDKIIFGRLNYNVKSSQYENNKQYYNDLCYRVIEFCKKNKIDFHIKDGTFTKFKYKEKAVKVA